MLEARLQNNERALEALGLALAENPMLPAVQLANGELLLLKGDYSAALESFEAAQKLMPNDVVTLKSFLLVSSVGGWLSKNSFRLTLK